jgi:hypothetical protein
MAGAGPTAIRDMECRQCGVDRGVNAWLTVILTLTAEKDRARGGSYPDPQAGISLFLLRKVANGGKDAGRGTRRVHLR